MGHQYASHKKGFQWPFYHRTMIPRITRTWTEIKCFICAGILVRTPPESGFWEPKFKPPSKPSAAAHPFTCFNPPQLFREGGGGSWYLKILINLHLFTLFINQGHNFAFEDKFILRCSIPPCPCKLIKTI